MSCCGKNRQALRTPRPSITAEPRPALTSRVTYTGSFGVLMRGPVTSKRYWFNDKQREQDVDPQDLAAILATGLFVPAQA